MKIYLRRLVLKSGEIRTEEHWALDRDFIILPCFDNGVVGEAKFLFDRELSDRDGIATFVEKA